MSKTIVTTPIGKVEWFSLNKPDKFGNYTCDLVLEDSPETHKLIAKIDEMNKGKKAPYTVIESNGSYKLKLKVKSQGQKKDGSFYSILPPVIYNSLGKKVEGEELERMSIGNGTELRAKVELKAYDFAGKQGVSVKPKAIQIAKLVEFGGGTDLGFDSLELDDEDLGEAESSNEHDF